MLALTRKILKGCEARNCVILDLPDGSRVRIWTITHRSGPSTTQVTTLIDGPRSVAISRGELLPPENSQAPAE